MSEISTVELYQKLFPEGSLIHLVLKDGQQSRGRVLAWVDGKIFLNNAQGSLAIATDYISMIHDGFSDATTLAEIQANVTYRRAGATDAQETPVMPLAIRLGSAEDFEHIDNPYAPYAENGPVEKTDMFYGRDELIKKLSHAIVMAREQSKSILLYGQKRSGKSSILYHLKLQLKQHPQLLILDVGNIGALLDKDSRASVLHKLLWSILTKLRDAIEDRVDDGLPPLNVLFPADLEFYDHPDPLGKFREIFSRFQRQCVRTPGWTELRPVILIDEFSYLYSQIQQGAIPDTFMINWKALLQENKFHAVLVGQDVMPQFKERFANEFGTTEVTKVTYLRAEDARRLIDEPIQCGPNKETRYRERAIDRILELTAGNPYYIQIVCSRLVDYMNRKRAGWVTQADVEQVKNELVHGTAKLDRPHFENLYNAGDESSTAISDDDALRALECVAVNGVRGPCHVRDICNTTGAPIKNVLNDLVERDVLERSSGPSYSIRVELFREWLLHNPQGEFHGAKL